MFVNKVWCLSYKLKVYHKSLFLDTSIGVSDFAIFM